MFIYFNNKLALLFYFKVTAQASFVLVHLVAVKHIKYLVICICIPDMNLNSHVRFLCYFYFHLFIIVCF